MWRGTLRPTDLLWQEGKEAGQPARSLVEPFSAAAPPPPGTALPHRRRLERPLIAGLAGLGAALTFTPWWSFFMVGPVRGTYHAFGWVTLGAFALVLLAVGLGRSGEPLGPARLGVCAALGLGAAGFTLWTITYVQATFHQVAASLEGNWFGEVALASQRVEPSVYATVLIGVLIVATALSALRRS